MKPTEQQIQGAIKHMNRFYLVWLGLAFGSIGIYTFNRTIEFLIAFMFFMMLASFTKVITHLENIKLEIREKE